MAKKNRTIGQIGENYTLKFLNKNGFILLEKNFFCQWGEIDLIYKKENEIHFVEVKTRIGQKKGKPYEAINYYKIKALKRTIQYYLLKKNIKNFKLSLDIASVVLDKSLKLMDFKFFENCYNFDLNI